MINECLDCNHKSKDAMWVVQGFSPTAPIHVNEAIKVTEDKLDNTMLDIDVIDAVAIAKKYNITPALVEQFIMDGYPACPVCGSKSYVNA